VCQWRDDGDAQSLDSNMSIENGTEGELMLDASSRFLMKKGDMPTGLIPKLQMVTL
jgi:hypothetical protein